MPHRMTTDCRHVNRPRRGPIGLAGPKKVSGRGRLSLRDKKIDGLGVFGQVPYGKIFLIGRWIDGKDQGRLPKEGHSKSAG